MADCERCEALTQSSREFRGLAREAGRFNAMLAPLLKEYGRLSRAHPRCAACGVLIGPQHAESELTPEPIWERSSGVNRGQRRWDVCPSCYHHLYQVHRSVPQQRRYEAEQAGLLGDELTTLAEAPSD